MRNIESLQSHIHVKLCLNNFTDYRKHSALRRCSMIFLDLSRFLTAFLSSLSKEDTISLPSFSHHLSSLHNLLQQSTAERSKLEELILRFSFCRSLRKIWQLQASFTGKIKSFVMCLFQFFKIAISQFSMRFYF